MTALLALMAPRSSRLLALPNRREHHAAQLSHVVSGDDRTNQQRL